MKKRAKSSYVDTWEGGYVRVDSKGRKTFVIRCKIDGRKFSVSTRTHTESAALEHWRRFQRSPSSYTPRGESGEALTLTDELVDEYIEWCESEEGGENTSRWAGAKRAYLEWWQERLGNRSLRRLSVLEIKSALDAKKVGAKAHRIAVLKHLYSWLRTERHSILPAEDPTFGALPVPQSNPRKRKISNKAFPKAHYLAAREHLTGHWRHALDVLAGTGAHVAAVVRFAAEGSIEPGRGEVAAVLVFSEKVHAAHRVPVSEEVKKAAEALLERGSLDRDKFDDAVRAACVAAGVAVHTPGRYRHAVASWAMEAGADPAQVAAFLGHRDARTTRRFYSTHAVPVRIPTVL